ncbi:MAG TPA: hypothetical protein VE422_03385 [Terriglobia bacterium]|nr:hypothetical protein [Terriglobia bacterium]
MRRSQGRYFSSKEIDTIKNLLSSTDMSLQDIAVRMDCAKSSIVTINRNYQIREYRGHRRQWVCSVSNSTVDTTNQQGHTISGSLS